MKIIQILTREGSNTIYGLGDDNNVYMWSYKYKQWDPTWTDPDEPKRMATVVNPGYL